MSPKLRNPQRVSWRIKSLKHTNFFIQNRDWFKVTPLFLYFYRTWTESIWTKQESRAMHFYVKKKKEYCTSIRKKNGFGFDTSVVGSVFGAPRPKTPPYPSLHPTCLHPTVDWSLEGQSLDWSEPFGVLSSSNVSTFSFLSVTTSWRPRGGGYSPTATRARDTGHLLQPLLAKLTSVGEDSSDRERCNFHLDLNVK